MDCNDPSGRKVGLLDRYHLMCFLVDPFSHEWCLAFLVQTDMAVLLNETIEMYIPLDDNGSNTARVRVKKEFQVRSYWLLCFIFNYQSVLISNKSLSIHKCRRSTLIRRN